MTTLNTATLGRTITSIDHRRGEDRCERNLFPHLNGRTVAEAMEDMFPGGLPEGWQAKEVASDVVFVQTYWTEKRYTTPRTFFLWLA